MPLSRELLRVSHRLWKHWDKFLLNYFETQILVYLELVILAEQIFWKDLSPHTNQFCVSLNEILSANSYNGTLMFLLTLPVICCGRKEKWKWPHDLHIIQSTYFYFLPLGFQLQRKISHEIIFLGNNWFIQSFIWKQCSLPSNVAILNFNCCFSPCGCLLCNVAAVVKTRGSKLCEQF